MSVRSEAVNDESVILRSFYHACPVKLVIFPLELLHPLLTLHKLDPTWPSPSTRLDVEQIANNLRSKPSRHTSEISCVPAMKREAHRGNSPPPFSPSSTSSSPLADISLVPSMTCPYPFSPL